MNEQQALPSLLWHLQYFAVGQVSAAKAIGFTAVISALVLYFDDAKTLRQSWSTSDVGPLLSHCNL